jgi:hypothetical protein
LWAPQECSGTDRQAAIHPSDQTVKFRRGSKNKIDTQSTQMVRKNNFKVLEQKGIETLGNSASTPFPYIFRNAATQED